MRIEIECPFDKELAPRDSYSLEVSYRYNRYFRYLSKMGAWFASDWFARFSPVGDATFSQEEPQHLRFELTIDDPRGRLLGHVIKTFEWDADPPPDSFDKQSRTLRLCWERNLKADEMTDNIIVAYRVGWIFGKILSAVGFLLSWLRP